MRFQILRIALRRLFKVDTSLFEVSKEEIRASVMTTTGAGTLSNIIPVVGHVIDFR